MIFKNAGTNPIYGHLNISPGCGRHDMIVPIMSIDMFYICTYLVSTVTVIERIFLIENAVNSKFPIK